MLKQLPSVTRSLLIINLALFLITFIFNTFEIRLTSILGGFYPTSLNFRFWQPLTHMFMHSGSMHILFNMFALFMFGSVIERALGKQRFLILYFVAGFGAFLLFNVQTYFTIQGLEEKIGNLTLENIEEIKVLATNAGDGSFFILPNDEIITTLIQQYAIPMVGASGAIYGLLIAYGVLYPNEKLIFPLIPIPIAAKFFIPALMLIELSLGLTRNSDSNIAHFAHIGGAITGLLFVLYWKWRSKPSNLV